MVRYTVERRDCDDGEIYYEIMEIDPPDVYRCVCVVEEDIEQPGQALTDARMIVQALEFWKKNHR
jgi:hypothetical protein